MDVLISLTFALVPSIVIIVFLLRKDRARPEPKRILLKVFLLGLLSSIPAILIELGLMHYGYFLQANPFIFPIFKAFVVAALVEEGLKFLIVKRVSVRETSFDEVMDGIVYAVMAGMGFACLENVLYVLGKGLTVALMRAFTSIPLHASVSVIMGCYIGLARFAGSKRERKILLTKGFLLAVLIHGLYDLSIFAMDYWSKLSLIGLPVTLIWSIVFARRRIRTALKRDMDSGLIPQVV